MKATSMPIRRIIPSIDVIELCIRNFAPLRRLAPNITGTARKKVYSAATVLEIPSISAPTMVAPEREVPGNIAAISWKSPI